jgi:membrane dipeptidase
VFCCAEISRRALLRLLAAGGAAAVAGCVRVSAEHQVAADRLVQGALSVDLHSHAGLIRQPRRTGDERMSELARGRLTGCVFTVSSDGPLLVFERGRDIYAGRSPEPGELYRHTYSRLQPLFARIQSGGLVHVKTAADLDAARAAGRPGAIVGSEGGDFLEGRLERVQEAYDRGLRAIQLVHYRVNELGDIQTANPLHGGLTPFGKDVIREMNRLGMLIDLAHATEADVRAAVEVSTRPMMISHTNLQNRSRWRRFVSPEHARLVTSGGGVIGSMPVAIGIDGMTGYVDEIVRLVDTVGADHVAIGTDMDGILPQSLIFDDYAEWPSIPAMLLARGVRPGEVEKILGGNFRRVFQAATSTG